MNRSVTTSRKGEYVCMEITLTREAEISALDEVISDIELFTLKNNLKKIIIKKDCSYIAGFSYSRVVEILFHMDDLNSILSLFLHMQAII